MTNNYCSIKHTRSSCVQHTDFIKSESAKKNWLPSGHCENTVIHWQDAHVRAELTALTNVDVNTVTTGVPLAIAVPPASQCNEVSTGTLLSLSLTTIT